MARIEWKEALDMERDVAILLQKQANKGIYFNEGKARYFISLLESKKENEYLEIRPYLDYEVINEESIAKPTKSNPEPLYPYTFVKKIKNKDGSYNKQIISHYDDPSIVYGPFSRISIEEPSISKRQLIVNQLLKHGWKPTDFTEKGFPQLTIKGEPVESLLEVGPFGQSLANWYIYNHRQSQISGFLDHIRDDGRISSIMTGLTNTFRHKHKVVANIPRPTSVFGKEMRSLFTVPEGKVFVGADVSGLELRMLAHWMNDEEYIHIILDGDVHTFNQIKAGLPTRDDAKTFIYAFLYGAGDAKIGSIVGGSSKEGRELREDFFSSIPSLRRLVDKVQNFVRKYGFIPSVDNRKIIIRCFEGRPMLHTALNAKLQADGSIVTKRAMLMTHEDVCRMNMQAEQIIFYHDEYAYESEPDIADELGFVMVDSMRKAGEYYNLRLPIDGKYAIGKDWSVH
jgi:DNA polymerase-1